jgi:hypothetical protein
MTEKSDRRWFRFSLRTLLVFVTLFCCWLAWETSVVHERKALRAELKGFQFVPAENWEKRFAPGYPAPRATAKVPLLRSWLGDEAIQEIWFIRHVQQISDEDLARLKKTFPEAELRESFPEPCHPGCFPRGTLVDTPAGPRGIETIASGELVTTISPSGEASVCTVQAVFITDNRIWKIETDDGVLFTTETQPLCPATDKTLAAGELQSGDTIFRRKDGSNYSVEVKSVTPTGRAEKVFNLILRDREIFVANGFLARSKPPAVASNR